MSDIIQGFKPIYNSQSTLLILGSFPSVKNRKVDFYYGNKQNRFWKTLCGYFKEETPETIEGKIKFLKNHKIALWDIVTECEIIGSQDSKIKNYKIADVAAFALKCDLKAIFLNGKTAYKIFCERFKDIDIPYYLLPSTSPANVSFCKEKWYDVLDEFYRR